MLGRAVLSCALPCHTPSSLWQRLWFLSPSPWTARCSAVATMMQRGRLAVQIAPFSESDCSCSCNTLNTVQAVWLHTAWAEKA